MQTSVTPRYEELSDKKTGRLWIDVSVDGCVRSFVHMSGPKDDVLDYFEGRATMSEIQRRWFPKRHG